MKEEIKEEEVVYLKELKSIMEEIRSFNSDQKVEQILKDEAQKLYNKMNQAIMIEILDVEDQKKIIYYYRQKFQSIKNRID